MKRAVITGPTGAIGMALITQCIREGWEVLAVCHRGSARISSIPVHPRVKVLETELSELGQLEQVIEGRYDVFYHFAWEGTTGAARNDMPLQTRNIASALQAAELAAKPWLQYVCWRRFPGGIWKDRTASFPRNAGISGKWIRYGKIMCRSNEPDTVSGTGDKTRLGTDFECIWTF